MTSFKVAAMNSVAGEVSAFTKERCARALRVMHLGKLIPIVSKIAQTIARCQDCHPRFFRLDIPKERLNFWGKPSTRRENDFA